MDQKTKDIQLQFEGFLKTPCLWKSDAVFHLEQFNIEQKSYRFDEDINSRLRLGKYVERFVSYQLRNEKSIEIISENLQIQQGKTTLGELDFIISESSRIIHLEVIYKFYLYDATAGSNELEYFIGPNKKDRLIEKLHKLKQKQLPLLYSDPCKEYLEQFHLNISVIQQKVYFKAQLFVPFSDKKIEFHTIDQDCIVGFYMNQKELYQFKDCKFYIPDKKNWLVIPHPKVAWIRFNEFQLVSGDYLQRRFSPLCWLKKTNGEIEKFFLTWW